MKSGFGRGLVTLYRPQFRVGRDKVARLDHWLGDRIARPNWPNNQGERLLRSQNG